MQTSSASSETHTHESGAANGSESSFCHGNGIQYTDVVVIGNGPSGMSLSYLLAGHWPYYTGVPHPDAYLQQRLLHQGTDTSIIEQDLEYLSNGLQGRSSNSLALLFDALTHPDADMGQESPSLLEWKYHEQKAVPHVVLGKKLPGGAWQMMEGKTQTLSLGNWMQLPNFPFNEWLAKHRKSQKQPQKVPCNRANIDDVRQYYLEYIEAMNITKYFRNYSTVTTVQKVLDVCHSVDDESGEQVPCNRDHSGKLKWEVCGYETVLNHNGHLECKQFCYRARNVVLATGTFDLPNRLHIPGEHFQYVQHSYTELESAIDCGQINSDSDSLVVVGAGLSAADAILVALNRKIPVVHLFRRNANDPNNVLKKLPEAVYPEYHRVHKMMKEELVVDGYQPYPMHRVTEFLADGQILIRSTRHQHTCDTIIKASQVLVLIGSQPDLSFLSKNGTNLGVVPDMGIDSKNNPMNVDMFSYQNVYECGLYAMGPLVGDNFVRFLRGGALGIVADLWKKREGKL